MEKPGLFGKVAGLFSKEAPPKKHEQPTQILERPRQVRPAEAYAELYATKGFITIARKEGGIKGILNQLRSMPEGSLENAQHQPISIEATIDLIKGIAKRGVMTPEEELFITSAAGLRDAVRESLDTPVAPKESGQPGNIAYYDPNNKDPRGVAPPELSKFPNLRPLHQPVAPEVIVPAAKTPALEAQEESPEQQFDRMFKTVLQIVREHANAREIAASLEKLAQHADKAIMERVLLAAGSAEGSAARKFYKQFLLATPIELRLLKDAADIWNKKRK